MIKVYNHITELQSRLQKERVKKHTIGFVPTMGALHEGHLSLIRKSLSETDLTVCSIFVNPLQFNNPRDLETYPRKPEQDISVLESAGCQIVFLPEVKEMYPEKEPQKLNIDLGHLDKVLEGKYRPGHFLGVATVIKRFFDIVQPDKAFFGKKDYQQLLVIHRLVEQVKIPTEIVPCPIIREADGLAMSSRNLRLTIGERTIAPFISQILNKMKEKGTSLPVRELKNWAIKKITDNPAFHVEYLEIVDKDTLYPLENWKSKSKAMVCTAVYLGDVRLIDNMELFS
ncbi:MAG: pantoate--beta-alanine ligase [Bacteroidota bacterium]|nr:pantoate--beta-alanine ligase [Bacteroidota bacterium]